MPKSKSPRKQHKPPVAPDQLWESLKEPYNHSIGLIGSASNVIRLAARPELLPHYTNPKEVLELARILTADLQNYKQLADSIYEHHRSKKGPAVSPAATMELIERSEEYLALTSSFTTVVLPNLEQLQILIDAAIVIGKEKEKKND